MRFSQLLQGIGEQCRRHPVVNQQRRPIVIRLPLELLRVPRLHDGRRRRRKQAADIADVQSPERADHGTLQQQLQSVTFVRMTQLMREDRQNLLIVADRL